MKASQVPPMMCRIKDQEFLPCNRGMIAAGFSRGGLRSRENGLDFTLYMGRMRSKLSVLVLWCVFLVLYLGGTVMLAIGLALALRIWWAAFSQHASLWVMGAKTAEVVVLGAGLLLILIVPLLRHRSVDRSGAAKSKQNTETDRRIATDKRGPLMTP